MKKLIIIIYIFFSISYSSAQDTTGIYEQYINSIDNFKTKYALKQFVSIVDFPSNYDVNFSKLSEDEQNKIIDHIYQLFSQKEFIGLYGLADELLRRFYYSANENIRKRIIEIHFNKICYISSSVVPIGSPFYYTEKTKSRLLNIIAKRWTTEDIEAWKLFIEQTINIYIYKENAQKIMKETNRQGKETEKYLLDSLIQEGIKRNLKINMNYPISFNCILMIGGLKDNRFIAPLEAMMQEYKSDKDSANIKEACTYALAKIGVPQYINKVFANKDNIYFRYLGTKEAFLRWLEINYVWNKGGGLNPESQSPAMPLALVTLLNIEVWGYIQVPKDIVLTAKDYDSFIPVQDYQNYVPSKDKQNEAVIKKAERLHQWIIANKDKLKLPPTTDYLSSEIDW